MEGPVLPFRPCLFEEIHRSSSMNTTVSHVVVSLVYGLEPLREALVDRQSPVVIRTYDIRCARETRSETVPPFCLTRIRYLSTSSPNGQF